MKSIFKLGEYQKLEAVKEVPMGMYLSLPDTMRKEKEAKELVLLPKREMPNDLMVSDLITVFIYKDSEDRTVATTLKPHITLGRFARLTVVQTTDIGAFLDWGLIKDLFLPFKEQTYRVKKGDNILVSLYIDKSERLCATMHLYELLCSDSEYAEGDMVSGTIYELSDNFGAFAAVDDLYSALIPKNELVRDVYIGEQINARVKAVRPDGRLTLSLRKKSYEQMDTDCEVIMEHLIRYGGFLPFHDKSTPDSIKREFGMSKSGFKRAIGRLYKNGNITIGDDGIRIRD